MSPTANAAPPQATAVVKRARDSQLMPPPPPAKRIKRPSKVLDEDVYADALARIIERDFFPGIEEARSQLGLLDALEARDNEWIEDASRHLSRVMTPGRRRSERRRTILTTPRGQQTPTVYSGDTPASVRSEILNTFDGTNKDDVNINMSLDAFVSRYTSEDNESFYKVIDKLNERKAHKYAWLRSGDNKIAAPRQIAHRERQKLLSAQTQQETADNNGQALLKIESKDDRPAMPDTWRARPDNQLMFIPEGIEETSLETVQQRAESNSKAAPKAVIYGNTRLAPPSSSDSKPPPSPSLSAVRDAIAGRPRRGLDSESPGSETPRVGGYAFVDDEASPSPEPEDPPSSLHPLLARADTAPSPFKLGEVSRRETLHDRMVDKITKSRRPHGTRQPSESPVPRFASSPIVKREGLSPAGQRLLSKVGNGTPKAGTQDIFAVKAKGKESSLRFRWTPTPMAKKESG